MSVARKLTDPKIWQLRKLSLGDLYYSMVLWSRKTLRSLTLNGLPVNQIITSCTKDQMKRFSFISPLSAQICGHNLCNLLSALPRRAGRGGAGQLVFPRGVVGQASMISMLLQTSRRREVLTAHAKNDYIIFYFYSQVPYGFIGNLRCVVANQIMMLFAPFWC